MQIRLHNRHFDRVFADSANGFQTVTFTAADGTELITPTNQAEAAVTINGCRVCLGGQGDHSLPLVQHDVGRMPNAAGQRLTLLFAGHGQLPAGLEVRVIYDAPDDVPVLIKSVRIDNDADVAVKLDHIEVETVQPNDPLATALLLESDYVRDAITVDGKAIYFPWIEHHHHYVRRLLSVVCKPHLFAYPVPLGRWLSHGQRFSSFRAYEYVLDNRGFEQRGMALRDASRRLFPWTNQRELLAQIPYSGNVQSYYDGIASAAEAGFDCVQLWSAFDVGRISSPLFTNFNDYVLNPRLFPNDLADVQKLTAFAHGHGLRIGFYTIYCQTWQGIYGKGPDAYQRNNWEQVWPFDHRESHQEPGLGGLRWGPALDPGTDWGLYINRKLDEFMTAAGFDSCTIDGPYYGDVSVADSFRACPPGGPNQVLGWERQAAFYQMTRSKGWNVDAAQGYHAFPHGMTRITTTGYVEGDFGDKSIAGQTLANRKAAYLFTYAYRPVQAAYYVPVAAYNPQQKNAPSLEPMEEKAALYDLALGFCFGYGFMGKIFMHRAFEGPRSLAVIRRWLGFWKEHEAFFRQGTLVHLREPDGQHLDGIVHVLPGDHPRALLVAYNPTDEERTELFDLSPLAAADLPTTGWRGVRESGAAAAANGSSIEVTVQAANATWLEMEL